LSRPKIRKKTKNTKFTDDIQRKWWGNRRGSAAATKAQLVLNKERKRGYNYRSSRDSGFNHNISFQEASQGDPSFNDFASEAYASPRGYAIRRNPMTGETEMFVAGTRNIGDHISNVWDLANRIALAPAQEAWNEKGLPPSLMPKHTLWKSNALRHYNKVARDNNVDVIYGHSRGGALVADMSVDEGVAKVGLSAATLIAHNKDIWNTTSPDLFSRGIGLSGHNNTVMDGPYHSNWHQTWLDHGADDDE
jgi:hypothetical protein